MIKENYEEAFSQKWIQREIKDKENELVILRKIIPWHLIIKKLVEFYDQNSGRYGRSLRVMAALLILLRFRDLSDREVIKRVKENRYMQYFCNIPDSELADFSNHTILCKFRKRLGEEGLSIIETSVFDILREAGVIEGETTLMDSTVLESNIVYPNDVLLIKKAFDKMEIFARSHEIPLWWDNSHLKKRWRVFNMSKKNQRASYLLEFYTEFNPALETFRSHVETLSATEKQKQKAKELLDLLTLLKQQTIQKLAGEVHIENRIVSLDEVDARPIKKGKSHPSCEFGTTIQMTFNRQGFMITTENFIGNPNDKTLYTETLELFHSRIQDSPSTVVTDKGYRSPDNFKNTPEEISNVFLGHSDDVSSEKRDFCHKARSATEGFVAVAKNLRGFGRSLYRNLLGDRIWTLLCQTAYNLKKFLLLYREQEIEQESLIKLSLA